jgi:hypothetical protein
MGNPFTIFVFELLYGVCVIGGVQIPQAMGLRLLQIFKQPFFITFPNLRIGLAKVENIIGANLNFGDYIGEI